MYNTGNKKFLEVLLLGGETETRIWTNKLSFEETLMVTEQEGHWKGSCAVVSSDNGEPSGGQAKYLGCNVGNLWSACSKDQDSFMLMSDT